MEEQEELKLSTAGYKNRKGFITKEEFLKMIKSLNFQYIANYEIKLVTGILVDCSKDTCETLGYSIKLNEYRY